MSIAKANILLHDFGQYTVGSIENLGYHFYNNKQNVLEWKI